MLNQVAGEMLEANEMVERQLGRGRMTRLVSFQYAVKLVQIFPGKVPQSIRDKFAGQLSRLQFGDRSLLIEVPKPAQEGRYQPKHGESADSSSEWSDDDDSVVPETPESQQGRGGARGEPSALPPPVAPAPRLALSVIPAPVGPSSSSKSGKGAAGRPPVSGGGAAADDTIYSPDSASYRIYLSPGKSLNVYTVPGVGEVVSGREAIATIINVQYNEASQV